MIAQTQVNRLVLPTSLGYTAIQPSNLLPDKSDGTDEGDLTDRLSDELQSAQRDRRNARNMMTALIAI
ncbi:MAG: hypothetical protein ACQKBV_12180, partial [Puniceicoccales bacterium]